MYPSSLLRKLISINTAASEEITVTANCTNG